VGAAFAARRLFLAAAHKRHFCGLRRCLKIFFRVFAANAALY